VVIGARLAEHLQETVSWVAKGPLGEEAVGEIDAIWEVIAPDAALDNYHSFFSQQPPVSWLKQFLDNIDAVVQLNLIWLVLVTDTSYRFPSNRLVLSREYRQITRSEVLAQGLGIRELGIGRR
jgi:hypothetical protein